MHFSITKSINHFKKTFIILVNNHNSDGTTIFLIMAIFSGEEKNTINILTPFFRWVTLVFYL